MKHRADAEAWKRIPLWFAIFVLLSALYMGWRDYSYMSKQVALMEHNFIEDVVGYDYCGVDEDLAL